MTEITEDFASSDKVIIVTGRAKDLGSFIELAEENLSDNFDLFSVDPLEEDVGIDGNVRWIGFISGVEFEGFSFEDQASRLLSSGDLGVTVCANSLEALNTAKLKYDYETDTPFELNERKDIAEKLEKFTPFTTDEVQYALVFRSLEATGKLSLMRGIVNDEQVMVLALVVTAGDEENHAMSIQPLALLLNTGVVDVETMFNIQD